MHSRLAQKSLFWLIVVGFWTATVVMFFYFCAMEIDVASGSVIEWRGYHGVYHALIRDLAEEFSANAGITMVFAIISLLAPIMSALALVRLCFIMRRRCGSKSLAS
jgi:hypothetical protein